MKENGIIKFNFFTEIKEYPHALGTVEDPKYKDQEYVRVTNLGDKMSHPVHEVEDYKKLLKRSKDANVIDEEMYTNFLKSYENYKKGKPSQINGTPLTHLNIFTKSELLNLNNNNINSLEELANIPDSAIYGMGISTLKDKAQNFLKYKKDNESITSVINQNNKLLQDNEKNAIIIAELQKQISELKQNTEIKSKAK